MNRKRSTIWNHFSIKSDTQAKCSYCMQVIKYTGGSTGNLLRHLKSKHVTIQLTRNSLNNIEESVNQIEVSVDNPNEIAEPVDIMQSTSSSIRIAPSTLSSIGIAPSTSSLICIAPSTSSRQGNITNYITKPLSISKSKAIDQQITKCIVKHYHPFSLVEETEFRNLIRMLAPNYSIPSRKTVSNNLLLQVYNDTFQKVSKDVQDASSVALTTDGWTSINNTSFIAILAHFINSETKLCSRLLGCINFNEKHTATELSVFLKDVVREWKLENKISAVVTDNASNIKAAIRQTNWRHVSCFAHVLNIGIQNGLLQLQTVMKKIKDIVEYFKRSSSALLKLESVQKQTGVEHLKLIQECKTRWNSAYHMMSRILKIKESVLSTLAIMNNDLNCINNQEWELIDSACNLLGIFNNVTEEMKDYEIQGQSIILDPRFKKFGFASETKFQILKTSLQQKLQALNVENELLVPNESNEQTAIEMPSTSTSDIWKSFDERRSLCVPATSVPSERVFSKAGQVLTQRRSRLTTSKVEKLIFVQANL
ncbi:unnamed protein product [Macrosiphum euphorbiae]|uniref:BED-type domain-containing protein n=1 Tax=Macrosiphum euphorbiae TaxID=13131 RepID=A0AAV0WB24_9HEMI|nr:unnamed protein product [Macrosiphum euphorbiae]